MKRVFIVTLLAVAFTWGVDRRTPTATAQTSASAPAKVEVATIRRNKQIESERAALPPNVPVGPVRLQILPGGRLTAMGISLMELVREAYGFVNRPAGNVTGPGWAETERFDVTIKADREQFGPPGPFNQLPQDAAELVRALLADRFKLKVRAEKKEQDIFELRMARADRRLGPGLTPADGSCVGIYAPLGPQPRCPFVLGGGRGVQTGGITMPELAVFFSIFPAVNRDVIDKTELPGAYDVKMSAFVGGGVANANADDPRPQMFTAVQDMLGLKLERVKGMANVLIIEHAERPSEN